MKSKLKKKPLPMCPKCKVDLVPDGVHSIPDLVLRYKCKTCDYTTSKVIYKRGNYEK